ncbi:MAG: hypothetical protein GXW85_08890 [Clostridia bacterium]|nr:hypothetical protein [Clostridia bacterium]
MKKLVILLGPILGLVLTVLLFINLRNYPVTAQIISVKYPAQIQLTKNDGASLMKFLKNADDGELLPAPNDPWFLLKITDRKRVRHFFFTEPHCLFDIENNSSINLPPQLASVLEKYLMRIAKGSPFGELIPWNEADKIFPRMAKGRIRDLETGLAFNIQRRGGSLHADVQPLTAQDTKIFKEIYQGRWSWKRRSVILETGERAIAASMNGMPHGQGAIYGNNFPGHFCLHFFQSQTHSRNLDTAHQLMVLKAAGKLESYLDNKTAREIVEIALIALRENDPQLVILTYKIDPELTDILEYMKNIAGLKIYSIEELEADRKYLVDFEWYEIDSGNNFRQKTEVIMENGQGGFLVKPKEISNVFKMS